MKIGHKLILAFLAVAMLVGAVGYMSLFQLQKIARPLNKDIPASVQKVSETSYTDGLAQFIRYYDEILTQSARNYAFTQDKRWEKRYRDVEPKLDKIIKEAIGRGDKKDKEFFSSVDKANLALVEMEYESIELVNNGRADEAVKILESSEYWNQKEICEQGLRSYVRRRGAGYDEALLASTETIDLANSQAQNLIKISTLLVSILVVVALILAIGIGFFLTHSISRPLTRLKAAAAEIGEGKLDTQIDIQSKDEIGELAASFNDMTGKLKESHTHLEEKVQERTTELSSTNVKLAEKVAERSSAQRTLNERIKELGCLFGLSKFVEQPDISLEQIFQETVPMVRNAYQYPDVTCVKITFEGMQYKTDNFEKSELSQYARINVRGDEAGAIEVYYLGESPESGKSPFLKEERGLLDAVAEHLSRVAERRQAGEKLQLFRNLIDRSNDSIFVTEPQWGRFLDVNEKACDYLGYTREELLNMTVKDIDDSILGGSCWTERTEEIRKEGYMIFESVYKRKDGTTFPVEINVAFIEQQEKSYLLAIVRDITERKQAEEALEESETRYRTLVEKLPAITYVAELDESSTTLYISPQVEEFLGVTSEEYKANMDTWRKQLHPDDRDRVMKELAESHEASNDFSSEYRLVAKDGRVVWFRDEAAIVYDPNGNPLFLQGIMYDINKRKQAEERQAELLEEIESINKELKDFAYIISHDLKAPLRGIKTLVNWITTDYADKLEEKGGEQMNLLSSRVDRMHNLIEGVLQYSRVGRVKEEMVQINLNELVPEIIDTIAPPENIKITVENELPVLEYEQTRIIQVFQNLLSNAVKYMDKPKGQIKVGCVEDDDFWKFSVADDGPGIEEKHFEKIFQMFQTLSPRDEFESTGVGLTVVKKIVEMYGGRIWVESKIGEGSTFFFTLSKQKMGVKDAKHEANIVS